MTKQEFMDRLAALDPGSPEAEITNDEYLTIETVYTFHPAISETEGKTQIAGIFLYGGMAVIKDMLPTAVKARRIEAELQEIRAKEHNLRAELERLRKGEEVEI